MAKMLDSHIDLGAGLILRNPVLTASGTFGYGKEYKDFVSFDKLGGFIVKGTTLHPREGNPYPRMAETPSGMLNAVGLQNPGIEHFISHIYPEIKDYPTNIIVNVSGSSPEDYVEVCRKLDTLEEIPAVEINISCPNVKKGGMGFGTSPDAAASITAACRKAFSRHLMIKLSPNVTDIVSIAKAVENAGADSVSLINTLLGMAVNLRSCSPELSTVTGGLSGPCVKPVALRMVWQVSNAVGIPIVGLGGICKWEDAAEFMLCGASAVQVGTANFITPSISLEIGERLAEFAHKKGFSSVSSLTGALRIP